MSAHLAGSGVHIAIEFKNEPRKRINLFERMVNERTTPGVIGVSSGYKHGSTVTIYVEVQAAANIRQIRLSLLELARTITSNRSS